MNDATRTTDASLSRRGPHVAAMLAAAFTWPLLFVGGLVTTFRVGMAVPDWPTTFGINMFLYDFVNASWGVQVEHVHRLYGAAVGLAWIGVAAWLTFVERRRWVVALGWVALLGVIGQGVLGGARVRLNSTQLAAVHGCTGQLFFMLAAALCVVTGRVWRAQLTPSEDHAHVRVRVTALLAVAYAQSLAGAWLRHFESPLALAVHSVTALAVVVLVFDVWARCRADSALHRPARRVLGFLILQVSLGIGAWWMLRPFDGIPETVSPAQALVRTGHQANAALLLGSCVALALRAWRGLASRTEPSRMVEVVPSRGLEVGV